MEEQSFCYLCSYTTELCSILRSIQTKQKIFLRAILFAVRSDSQWKVDVVSSSHLWRAHIITEELSQSPRKHGSQSNWGLTSPILCKHWGTQPFKNALLTWALLCPTKQIILLFSLRQKNENANILSVFTLGNFWFIDNCFKLLCYLFRAVDTVE